MVKLPFYNHLNLSKGRLNTLFNKEIKDPLMCSERDKYIVFSLPELLRNTSKLNVLRNTSLTPEEDSF
jgi:hypothetical protein